MESSARKLFRSKENNQYGFIIKYDIDRYVVEYLDKSELDHEDPDKITIIQKNTIFKMKNDLAKNYYTLVRNKKDELCFSNTEKGNVFRIENNEIVNYEEEPIDIKSLSKRFGKKNLPSQVNEYLSLQKELDPGEVRIDVQDENKSCSCLNLCSGENKKDFKKRVRRVVNLLELRPRRKALILDRYVKLVEWWMNRKNRYKNTDGVFKLLTQTGGIATPALLSIQNIYGTEPYNPIFWAVWGISLGVGLLINLDNIYKIRERSIKSSDTYEKLISEGWAYFELSGKYGIQEGENKTVTHESRFQMFCKEFEEINRLAIEDNISSSNVNSSNTDKEDENE